MIAVAFATLPVFILRREIGRRRGLMFLGFYAAYVAYLILGAQDHDALDEFSAVMLSFVLPITVVTLVAMVIRGQGESGAATGKPKE
jgi:cation:H+ antiporter